jgi:predicted nucleotidyltransferase
MVDTIINNIHKIKDACKEHEVKELYLFGSAARGNDFNEKSDIDFLVSFQPFLENVTNENVFKTVKNFETLHQKLESITKRKVDLIQEKSIRNKYLRHFINKEKIILYGLS